MGLCFFIGGLNFHSPFVFPFLVIVIAYIASNYIYRWTTSRIRESSLDLSESRLIGWAMCFVGVVYSRGDLGEES